jgi:hypothetical protein
MVELARCLASIIAPIKQVPHFFPLINLTAQPLTFWSES